MTHVFDGIHVVPTVETKVKAFSKALIYVSRVKVSISNFGRVVFSFPKKAVGFLGRIRQAFGRYLKKCHPGKLVASTLVACAAADVAIDLAVGIGMPWLMPVGIAVVAAILLVAVHGTYKEYKTPSSIEKIVWTNTPETQEIVDAAKTEDFVSPEFEAALQAAINEGMPDTLVAG